MIPLILFILILAIAAFAWMKNKSENRNIERHNRLIEKQEELMKLIKEKTENNFDKNES